MYISYQTDIKAQLCINNLLQGTYLKQIPFSKYYITNLRLIKLTILCAHMSKQVLVKMYQMCFHTASERQPKHVMSALHGVVRLFLIYEYECPSGIFHPTFIPNLNKNVLIKKIKMLTSDAFW